MFLLIFALHATLAIGGDIDTAKTALDEAMTKIGCTDWNTMMFSARDERKLHVIMECRSITKKPEKKEPAP